MLEKQVPGAGGAKGHHSAITVLHVRPWVRWWFYIGIFCGAVALANIFLRNLTGTQVDVVLFLGAMHWLLGGLVCWAWDGIKIEKPQTDRLEQTEHLQKPDFNVPAGRPMLTRISAQGRLLTEYLRRWEEQHHA
jgi:hypothetical protein